MELAKSFEPHAIEAKWYPIWESRGDFKPTLRGRRPRVLHPAPAAERHGHAAHGSCVPADADGRADPLPPDARRQHAVAARHRPRRHRDADRRRAAAEGARRFAPRARPGEIRRTRLGVEGSVRLDDHEPDATARHVGRLVARALHDGRGAFRGGARNVRPSVRRRPHLSRQAPRQLGPDARHGGVGPRSRERRGAGKDLGDPLPGRLPAERDVVVATTRPETMLGDVAVAVNPDDERYAALVGPDGDAAAHRPHDSRHRRRLRRQGVRHRLRQDHARARLQRLGGRAAPQSGADSDPESRRDDQRQRAREIPRTRSLRGAQGSAGGSRGTRPHRQREGAPDGRAALRPHGRGRRADADGPMVRRDEDSGARHPSRIFPAARSRTSALPRSATASSTRRTGERGRVRVRARPVAVDVPPLDQQHPGLVHLAAALVGPPHSGVVRRRRQCLRRAQRSRGARAGRREARSRADVVRAGRGRARHLVLVGAVVPLDARLAGRHARACARSFRRRCSSRASTSSSSGSRG